MADKDLHSIVQTATETNKNNKMNKVQLGYTVNSYNGVLADLQQAKLRMLQNAQGDGGAVSYSDTSKSPIFTRWTELDSITIGGIVNGNDGFVVGDGNNYETFRQQQCMLQPFMSFVVTYKPPNKDKEVPYLINFDPNNDALKKGESITRGAGLTYPSFPMQSDDCDKAGIALGNIKNPFEIGIAVDLTKTSGTVDAFFNKCYNKIYKDGIGAALACKNALMAEIAFVNGGTEAKSVHVRIIANSGATAKNRMHNVYFPIPLLLTDEYKSLGQVYVDFDGKKQVGKDCKSTFASSKYSHEGAKIEQFTPEFIKDIFNSGEDDRVFNGGQVVFCNASAINHSNLCFIRFYIDKTKEQQILSCLNGGAIPDEYRKDIFKGIKEADVDQEFQGYSEHGLGYIDPSTIGHNGAISYTPNEVDWEKLKTSKYSEYVQYKDVIEKCCSNNDISVRLLIAHSAHESGYLKSAGWTQRYNPAGLLGTGKKRGSWVTMQGIRCYVTDASNYGGDKKDHGPFLKFDTPYDGWECFARWVTKSSYYGVKTKGLKTVGEYTSAMQNGINNGPSFCGHVGYRCPKYASSIITHYEELPTSNQS